MKLRLFILSVLLVFFYSCKKISNQKPNIIIIYADDLGFGDIGAYGATAIKTPNIDKIAQKGIQFTNAYATSATCTPSRYSLLTGTYPWRKKRAKVLQGDAPMLISTDNSSLPAQLQKQGYTTGIVGKWHLGLGNGKIDWNSTISPCPNDVGFNYSYIMAATNDRVPTVYVENGKVVNLEKSDSLFVNYHKNFKGLPTGKDNPELLKLKPSHGHDQSIHNGISRIGYQKGGKKALWIDENMADTFLNKALSFIDQQKEKPFFLYYALNQPHVPRTPNHRFVGSTSLGARGDAIVEADWCIGSLMEKLEKDQLLDNTLIIITSDNGPVLDDGYQDNSQETAEIHSPTGQLRGGKYSLFDAGTHIPFIVFWKGHTQPKISNAIISQVDLKASLLALKDKNISQINDSKNLLNTLLGNELKGRKSLIIEGLQHRTAIRKGDWIFIPPYKGSKMIPWGVQIETGFSEKAQLYS
ncbi:MAG: sulfatase-like hydrolase/transferase [Flavobacteriaceae bacterium]|nr:sulfatase-like hydrolase/transferase [Flavobacteriaceae bacterium]